MVSSFGRFGQSLDEPSTGNSNSLLREKILHLHLIAPLFPLEWFVSPKKAEIHGWHKTPECDPGAAGSSLNSSSIFWKRRFQPTGKKNPLWKDWDEESRFKSCRAHRSQFFLDISSVSGWISCCAPLGQERFSFTKRTVPALLSESCCETSP